MRFICPCVDCVCVPICRHKLFNDMISSCILVHEYLTDHRYISGVSAVMRHRVSETLKPTKWRVDHDGYFISKFR